MMVIDICWEMRSLHIIKLLINSSTVNRIVCPKKNVLGAYTEITLIPCCEGHLLYDNEKDSCLITAFFFSWSSPKYGLNRIVTEQKRQHAKCVMKFQFGQTTV